MDEQKSSQAENIAKSVEKISDSKGLAAIGTGLGWGIGAIGIALIYWAIFVGSKWDGHLHSQENCYKLQEINGKTYKVNTCTGETEEFIIRNKSNK